MLYSDTMKMGKISSFTLGTVQLGIHYGMANTTGQPSVEQAFEILDAAAEAGVNSLDTAVAYGTSEQVIGEYLKQSSNRFFITSKFRVGTEEPEKTLRQQAGVTAGYLGKTDMYFFHNGSEMAAYAARLEEPLRRLKEEGMCRYVGASVYEAKEIEEFLKYDWMDGIQFPMNILDDRIVRSGLLEELSRRGVTVFVRSVFLQGLLCMDKAPEKYAFLEPYVEELRDVARAEGMSLKQLAVAYVRELPGVSSLVLGCETAGQVKENAELVSVKPVSAAGTAAIRGIAARIPIEDAMARILGK